MSENSLIALDFEGKQVRMVGTQDEPEWVAADVCDVLGIRNSRQALSRLDEDEKGVTTADTLGGRQEIAIVNEPGLYALIGKSRKDEAKRFGRWIRHDVLPCIRKHGCYPEPEVVVGSNALLTPEADAFVNRLGEMMGIQISRGLEPTNARLDHVEEKVDDLAYEVQQIQQRKKPTKATRKRHSAVVYRFYRGMCPCCNETMIVGEDKTPLGSFEIDHWTKVTLADVKHTWAVCTGCNSKLRNPDWKGLQTAFFQSYQKRRQQFEHTLNGPSLFTKDQLEEIET